MENKDKTKIRENLESLEHTIHLSWLRDLDKTNELLQLKDILSAILNSDSIEDFFDKNESDFEYFIKKFSRETINNILRQHYVYGEDGDEIASVILLLYLKIFLKFMQNNNYMVLWESVKEIFDSSKPYYKGMGFNTAAKIDTNKRFKKQMSAEYFNENFLQQNESRFSAIKANEEIDVLVENRRQYHSNDKKIWTRGIVHEVSDKQFSVKTAEDPHPYTFNKNSFEYSPCGSMTKDYSWRTNLKQWDVIDCQDRGRWFPATVMGRSEEIINGLKKVDYKIGFRIYPATFPEWQNYTKFWPDKTMAKDSKSMPYFGDQEGYDETISSTSKRLQIFGLNTSGGKYQENEGLSIDDYILFNSCPDDKKFYVVGKGSNFSYFYALLINEFAKLSGYEKLLNLLHKDNKEKVNSDLLYYTFFFIGNSSNLFHKEYIKILGEIMKENVINYLNDLNQNDLRNVKKETIELITKVLKYYLSFSLSIEERNEVVENFGLSFSLKMLKTSLLDKRISAVKTIVDMIKSAKNETQKSLKVLKIIEEHKIFYEIYGPNSHIQLINKSKDLLEIMLQEDKLSSGEMEIIWNGTKKGDLEGKLTILKTLKEISSSLKEKHIKMLLENIYQSEPNLLINEEIDLIFDLATHQTQPESELEKCVKFFLAGLYTSKTDDVEKTGILIRKIFEISKLNSNLTDSIITELINNLKGNKNSVLSFRLLAKFIIEKDKENNENNNAISDKNVDIFSEGILNKKHIVDLYKNNFLNFKTYIKNLIDSKNWKDKDIDNLPFDNFIYSDHIRTRLRFFNILIVKNLWESFEESIEFIFSIMINDSLSDKDSDEFYKWIKKFIEKNEDMEIEEKIFDLFNNKICNDNKKCQNLSIQAFESYLKLFLDINKKNKNLDYNYTGRDDTIEISVAKLPDTLIGFEILWKIIFQSFSVDIMNKGIEILHILYNNIQIETKENQSEVLLKKCIDLIQNINSSDVSADEKHNIITKCLHVLNLMIEESEKKGTARVKSHKGLIKNKIIKLKINSYIPKVDDSYIRVFGNTTMWDLREIISKKVGIAVDFIRMRLENYEVGETDNGKTVLEMNLSDDDEIKTLMNSIDDMIPQVDLTTKSGQAIPQIINVFNEWYDSFSTNGKMQREDCARFVKTVTNARDDIPIDDHRVNYLIQTYDQNNEGYVPRQGFVSFYTEAARKQDKKQTVWENLRNMGYRNDLKRLDEPYELHNVDKNNLPRYNLSHNENFFNAIFKLQDSDENIAKEAFSFLCKITTNPIIYRNILNGKDNWNNLLDSKNIYKLIYSLQIIESFLEDIEIDYTGVDSFANEESILDLDSNNLEIEEMKQLKITWMKNFVSNNGFSHLVEILHLKLAEYSNISNNSETTIMNKICIQFLLKIIRIFYNGSLNKFQIFKEVNQLINSIKKLNSSEMQESIENNFPSIKKRLSKDNNSKNNNEQEELIPADSDLAENESTNLSRKESLQKENELGLQRKKSAQLDTNLLEKIFEGDLGLNILSSLNNIQLIKNLIELLINFNSKQKISNEDADILENSFELFCALLSFSEQGKEIELLILKEKKEEFSKLCLHGLLNKTSSIREKYCFSLIKLVKILTHYEKFDLVSFLFFELFKFINSIENYDPDNNIFSIKDSKNKANNFNDNSNLNTTELFELFSNVFEIYLNNKNSFEKNLENNNSNELSPNEFLNYLSKTISDDINNLNDVNLKNDIFLGYLKILAKVVENNNDMKKKISTNFNLIQDIMTKILFKQSNKQLNEKVDKLKFINPEKFNNHKDNRNTNQQIRNSCFKFILSMLNNSIKNFEKFFEVNILDDDKEKEEENDNNNNNQSNRNNAMSRYEFYNFNNTKVEDHVGLRNLGCICYMNSMLQQFFMVPTFRRAILQVDDGVEPDTNNNLNVDDNPFHQIQRMFSYLEMSNREDYNPEGFCFSFKDWDGNPTNTSIQQDAQEFLSRFLDKIEFALKPTDYKYLMHSVFGGKSCSQLICEDGCGTSKNRYEDMFFLSLEVSNMKTIYDSLDKYISPEKIDDFNCETCKKKVTITKRNVLSDLPNTLIVHLQRIFYNYEIDRNEKINSKLEFPKVLNLKNYTIEEMARKNAAKHASNLNENEENNNEPQFENDEIYFRDNEYYEYHLVGVNIHIGSADAGHYFSYINTIRNGNENEMTFDPKNENHLSSWLKFNDSRISKFTISKLEEECFGGKLENGESDNISWNFRANFESIQSAYMLVYERRVKSPIKIIVNEKEANDSNIISYKEEQETAIKKNYDLMYHLGKNTEEEIKQKIYNSVFYDNTKNEYYKYLPFFGIERKLPKKYYLEIVEDNNQLEKHQNMSDENSSNFFENVINLLDDALNKNKDNSEEICDRIVISFINFIFNILSNKDKEKLLKIAKDKFIILLGENKFRINTFIKFIVENPKHLQDTLFHESSEIVSTHCDLIFNALKKAYELNPKAFMQYLNRNPEDNNNNNEEIEELSINAGKLFEILLGFFPKVNNKLCNRVGPLLQLIQQISEISDEILKYLSVKEYIYIFITFLIGKESPCYEDTLTRKNENWDYARLNISNPLPLVELIYKIFTKNSSEEENKNEEINTNSQNPEIKEPLNSKLSERDLKCIKHPSFLKMIYKCSNKIFCDLLIKLNTNNYEFTKLSCLEITKFIDDITGYDENEIFKLVKCILKIIEIEDKYQILRFNILLGYPQLMVEEPTYKSNLTLFGSNLIRENQGRYIEIRGLYNVKNTSCLMKKIFNVRFREKILIEVFLIILQAARKNLYLLKYIRNFNAEDQNTNDYISYGVSMINSGKRSGKDNANYLDELKIIVNHLNDLLSNQMEKVQIPRYNSFMGKYYHKDIKREIYELIHSEEGIYIFKVDYHTSKCYEFNEMDENLDPEEDLEDTYENKGNSYIVANYETKINNEKEFFKRLVSGLQQTNKKFVLENKYFVKENTSNIIRYVALNAMSRDVNINFKISLNNINEETKPNEFIPSDFISTNVPCYTVKNLCVLSKINTDKNWSFEADSTQPDANLEYEFNVELLEYKSMNSNYYGYGQNQNRMYFNNQENAYVRQNAGSGANRYTGISNMDNYYDEEDEFNQKKRH